MCCLKGGIVFSGVTEFSNWTFSHFVTKRIREEMVSIKAHNDDKLKKNLITEGLFQRIRNCCAIHNQKKKSRVLQFRSCFVVNGESKKHFR